jgi:hypothetical protein
MSTNTNGDERKTADYLPRIEARDKASKLSTAAMICGVLGLLFTVGIGLGCSILAMAPQGYLVPLFGFYLGITLALLAVIFGVVSLRRNPTSASRRNAKTGLLLVVLPFVLFGLLCIVAAFRG